MKQVEIVDILSTAHQQAHVGYLTHTLCTGGTATLLFNGGKYTVRRSDCVIVHRSELYGMDEVITSPQADLLQRFLQLLEDKNYYEHRDIGWYADKLCVTPKYLSETTKAISGFAANYWIDRYTALEISRLLPQQQLSIADIAYKMNFSSISHFTRFVRTQLGIRPTDLRQ